MGFEGYFDLIILTYVIIILVCLIMTALFFVEKSKNKTLEKKNEHLLNVISGLIDTCDLYDRDHYKRVAHLATAIGRRMGKNEEEIAVIRRAAMLYDVGMILVNEDVLKKPEALTMEEFDSIRIHPVSGYHILRDLYKEDDVILAAKYHHEKYDGTGYPNGLARKNIPEIARIIAVADACDAMRCHRNYREALSVDDVRAEFKKCRGTQFDPDITDIMLSILDTEDAAEQVMGVNDTKNILVVDDDRLAINVAKNIIGTIPGCRVYTAQTYANAEKIMEKVRIDLVFLDLVMPDTDGFDSYENIKHGSDVPVVFMTGEKSLDIIMKASSLGAADYLVKPLSHAVLKETVRSILGLR